MTKQNRIKREPDGAFVVPFWPMVVGCTGLVVSGVVIGIGLWDALGY